MRSPCFLDICVSPPNNYFSHKQTPWPESASELYRPSDLRLSTKLVPTSADRGRHVVIAFKSYWTLCFLYGRCRVKYSVCSETKAGAYTEPPFEITATAKQGSSHHRKFCTAHTATRFAYVDYITRQEVIQNHENDYVRSVGQWKPDTENVRDLNLAAVKPTTFQVTKLPL
jgi:hypothetical protein